jgi:hypothetical protein
MASKIYSGEEAQSSNLAAGHVNSGIAPAIVARGPEDENLCSATFTYFVRQPTDETGLSMNRRSLQRNMSIPESPRPLSPPARQRRTSGPEWSTPAFLWLQLPLDKTLPFPFKCR